MAQTAEKCKSLELCKMFLKGRTETNLSKKQASWLADVMNQEGCTPNQRWKGTENYFLVREGLLYRMQRYSGIGRLWTEKMENV